MKSTGVVCALLASAAAVAAAPAVETAEATKPTIYLIRHAEKDSHGLINERGKQREKCLVDLFGQDSDYNINYMIAPKYHFGGMFYLFVVHQYMWLTIYSTRHPAALQHHSSPSRVFGPRDPGQVRVQ